LAHEKFPMTNFKNLRTTCEKNSELSKAIVDDFLIYFAAQNAKLDREMDECLARFRHITQQFPPSWVNMIKAQYITHRIFKKEGLIRKFLNNSALKHFTGAERNYLEHQAKHPWRFSYSVLTDIPVNDFFKMEDVFSGETFLLYSPGIADILKSHRPRLWFNLIAFNGACWQTYGPIAAYMGFEPDDVFFFATEMHPHLESEEDIMRDVEQNHIPYAMLASGAMIPLTVHKNDQIIQAMAEHALDDFSTHNLKSDFTIEYNKNVYKLSLKQWADHPHFSVAYYDEKRKALILTSMTDKGFETLVQKLNVLGYDLTSEPDIRVNISMTATAGKILMKKIRINSYEHLFQKKSDPRTKRDLDKLNHLMALVLSEINAGKEPDLEALAKEVGVEIENARQVMVLAINQINEMRKRS